MSPGSPIKRARSEAILANLTERCAEGESPLDYVCALVASGTTLRALMTEIAPEIGEQYAGAHWVERALSSRWDHEQVIARLTEARAQAAHALAEEALHIVDSAPADRDELARAKLRAEGRQWLATKWNRPVYGDKGPDVNVQVTNVTLKDEHLAALRRREIRASIIEPDATPALPAPASED